MYFGETYGLEGHLERWGYGENLYRGEDFAQPRALKAGDTLENGFVVSHDIFVGRNSSVGIRFTNGLRRVVVQRLPLQLLSERSKGILPAELAIGQILQTGEVVLAASRHIGCVELHEGQDETEITITSGIDGATLGVPSDLPIAVHEEVYPPSAQTAFGAFVLERTLSMNQFARRNLPQLGQLTLDLSF